MGENGPFSGSRHHPGVTGHSYGPGYEAGCEVAGSASPLLDPRRNPRSEAYAKECLAKRTEQLPLGALLGGVGEEIAQNQELLEQLCSHFSIGLSVEVYGGVNATADACSGPESVPERLERHVNELRSAVLAQRAVIQHLGMRVQTLR